MSLAQPGADYGMRVTLAGHFERSNSTVLAVGQFETADYADGIDAAMAALDVAFIGPVDLRGPRDAGGAGLGADAGRR
ncbi:hypothetical protein [Sinomonas sp. P10A9]|uniref:Uncharacterized protein n=1 Tax=Sinomonas puerhi TaxID=3238584 RepID=A0AB39L7R3_9MICC